MTFSRILLLGCLSALVACGDEEATTPTLAPTPPPEAGEEVAEAPDAKAPVAGDLAGGKPGVLTGGQTSQEAIKAGEHVTIAGVVTGQCTGALQVELLAERADLKASGPPSPPIRLASAALTGPGEFILAVPKGARGSLGAVCDNDNNNQIGEGDLAAAEGRDSQAWDTNTTGLELGLTPISFARGQGAPGGGPGKGAPPPADAPAGPPPSGG